MIGGLADTIFSDIAELTQDGEGVTRAAYGEGESKALAYMEALAARHGLTSQRDAAGNVFFGIEEAEPERYVLVGSHLDSVPHGGNFDGLAGVAAGVLLLIDAREGGFAPTLPLRAVGFRGEESAWYGHPYLGSKAALGLLTAEELASPHRDSGRPLADCMADIGAERNRIAAGTPLLDTGRLAAFLELHIEQGPVLVERKLPIGVVTGIRGNIRHHRLRCVGEAGHSGAVPRWLRRDAVFATCELITRMDDHWDAIQQHGGDLVLTAGVMHTDPEHDTTTRIPGEVTFSFEARSQNEATLDAMAALMRSECGTIERDRRVKFEFDPVVRSDSAEIPIAIIDSLRAACRDEGLADEPIASGAGHDATIFANAGVPTGMLFVRNRNGSHNPKEELDLEDFLAGYAVLRRFLSTFESI